MYPPTPTNYNITPINTINGKGSLLNHQFQTNQQVFKSELDQNE